MFSVCRYYTWFISHVYVTIISFFSQIKQNVKFFSFVLIYLLRFY